MDDTKSVAPHGHSEWFGPRLPDPASIKILVVDDNEALRYTVVRSLRDEGYQIAEAATATEGLRLSSESPDLILLDINLPDMSGFQVCKQLKAAPLTCHIPILHISSTFVDAEYRVRGLRGGADAYLTEPIDRAELIATVNALLRLKLAETTARQQAGRAEAALSELQGLNQELESRIAERTAELTEANESLRELSSKLLQAQDDERRKITRDLHDSVGQTAVALKMNNSIVVREAGQLSQRAFDAATENSTLIDEIIKSIRTISHLLHPQLLDAAGLSAALEWYLQEFGSRSGVQVSFDSQFHQQRLSAETEIHIFRIVQECLGNVHRHSQSQTARVRLSTQGDRVLVEIADDGIGISASRLQELRRGIRSGVGFRGMRERLAQIGGELTVHSEGKGTTIKVEVPFERKARPQAAT